MQSLFHLRRYTLLRNILSRRHNTISALQAAFKDPSSPFHIPPGTQGPSSPEPESEGDTPQSLQEATQKLRDDGYDPASFWEQPIGWGDQDAFQHVNNVRYIRFFESSRVRWMMSLGMELGGREKADAMVKGKGVSLILKSIEVRFRRPVTYPDRLLVGYRPKPPKQSVPANEDPSTFTVTAAAYSLTQRAVVATSNEALVWYDYDRLKKCYPGDEMRSVVFGRAREE